MMFVISDAAPAQWRYRQTMRVSRVLPPKNDLLRHIAHRHWAYHYSLTGSGTSVTSIVQPTVSLSGASEDAQLLCKR
jgi:hypothetical protein